MSISFGCDPELFLKNSSGKFISSIGLVGGSKEDPRPIGNGCFVQEDNVAVEFNIPPVEINNVEKAVVQIKKHFVYVLDWLENNVCKPNNLEVALVPSAIFDPDQLDNEAAQTFGCDPDYNAYSGDENPKPTSTNPGLRTAGGHVHVGGYLMDNNRKMELVREFDAIWGLYSIIEDTDTARRELYGKAGAFRFKPYGVEYRTLSNYWVTNDKALKRIISYLKSVELMQVSIPLGTLIDEWSEGIQQAINTQDKMLAEYLLDILRPEMDKCLFV